MNIYNGVLSAVTGATNTLNIELIIIIILAILLIVCIALIITLFVQVKRINSRLRIFMSGKDAISLEESITGLESDVAFLKDYAARSKKEIRNLYKRMETTYQKMGLVKYDAFKQMGGQLSFSLVLLDEHDNGFLINSVHSTDGCYSYTKAIVNGECELALGREEQQALDMAKAKK